MRRFLSRKPSPAMAVAFIALLAALSGTAVALPGKNTVDSGDIKKGAVKASDIARKAVTRPKIRNRAVNGQKVQDDSLTGTDINESTLGQVPLANTANSANTANTANSANTANTATTANRALSAPYPSELGSGETMKGVYGLECDGSVCENGFSFPVPLATRPTKHLIREGGAPPAECPGTFTNPAAAPGHLCVFEGTSNSAATLSLFDPQDESFGPTVSRFGFGVAINDAAGSNHWSHGTWAATAP